MNINKIFPVKFNKLNFKHDNLKQNSTSPVYCKKNYGNISYDKNYYLNSYSFTGKYRANDAIEAIGKENFPSPEIYKTLKRLGASRDFSLYEIHLNHYKDLLKCKTLEEAKEKYPEFEDVLDAKNVDINSLYPNNLFIKIAQGKIEGADIENLSLELLKKQYGNFYSASHKENYYNLSQRAIYRIFSELNIKKLDNHYIKIACPSNPDVSSRKSKSSIETWAKDDGTRRDKSRLIASTILQSDEAKERSVASMHTDEYRNLRSALSKKTWAKDDGTRREKSRLIASTILQSDEAKDKALAYAQSRESRKNKSAKMREYVENHPDYGKEKSRLMKLFHKNNPQYVMAQKIAWKRHPEITVMMSEVAKKYPMLSKIFVKLEENIELNESETKTLLVYYKECENKMPGYSKVIGEEYHKVLVELGLKK